VNEIEKKAKALEQDREEQQDLFDVNEFFEEQVSGVRNDQSKTS